MFDHIEKSTLYQFAGLGAQSSMSTIKKFVLALQDKKRPNIKDAGDSSAIHKISNSLTYWCVCETFDDKGENIINVGPAAPKLLWESLRERHAINERLLVLDDLKMCEMFAWRLENDQQTQLVKWREEIIARDARVAASGSVGATRVRLKLNSKKSQSDIDEIIKGMAL